MAAEPSKPLGWNASFLWLALAVACFQAAYTSIQYPAAGLAILGDAFALVRLTDQPTVRRAFYFALVTAFLCYGPQLWFFFNIFNVAAVILWLILAFWVGLFSAIVCGCIRRWGRSRAVWLIPIVWTGVEYFRSELYYLQFSWLNVFLGSFKNPLKMPIAPLSIPSRPSNAPKASQTLAAGIYARPKDNFKRIIFPWFPLSTCYRQNQNENRKPFVNLGSNHGHRCLC